MLLAHLLNRLIRTGRLTVIDWEGRSRTFGRDAEPAVTIRLKDRSLGWKLFWRPELCCGEAFTDGTLIIERGSIYDFLELVGRNLELTNYAALQGIAYWLDKLLRRLHQFNPVGRAQSNVAHHYDLTSALYELFLDSDLQYSCAYFLAPSDDLDRAQQQKKRHIASKLLMRPGMRVLDIGSGWGGMALYLAKTFDAEVTGITLSAEQLRVATDRARRAGLSDRVQFALRDYRAEHGRYDRIVSVGMFEHVGVNHFDEFFATVHDCLTDDGVAVLHTIGRLDGPGITNPWIRRYIFPGGYIPALSEVLPAIENKRLLLTDVEVLRLHYANTLRLWRERFRANRTQVAELLDERFCRMWEFYLAGSEMTFRHGGQAVFQIQMAKRIDTVPLTREYISEMEQFLAQEEADAATRLWPWRSARQTIGQGTK